ncbi:MAG: FlgD immunoglobulin-like domain containing protein [Candidatus Krumholzibacteriia bacterium]
MRARLLLVVLALLLGHLAIAEEIALNVACESFWQPGPATAVDVSGPYAWIGNGNRVQALDLTTLPHPTVVGELAMAFDVRDLAVAGEHLYVVCADGLWVLSIADPAHPLVVNDLTPGYPMPANMVEVVGDRLYYGDAQLHVYDLADPAAPVELAASNVNGGGIVDIAVVGGLAYVALGDQAMSIVDVSDPTDQLDVLSTFDIPGQWVWDGDWEYYVPNDWVTGIAVAGTHAFLSDAELGLRVFDIADPTAPMEIARLAGVAASDLALVGDRVYLAADSPGFQVVDISDPAAPALVQTDFGLDNGGQVLALGGRLYLAGENLGLRILEPTLAGQLEIGAYRTWGALRDVAWLDSDLIAVVDFVAGLRVFSTAAGDPLREVGFLALDDPRCLYVAGSLAYVTEYSGGLDVIDLADPTAPVLRGTASVVGNALNVAVQGDYAYVAALSGGVRVVDVSDPDAPVEVSAMTTAPEAADIVVDGDLAYVADQEDGLLVVSLAYPQFPSRIRQYPTPGQCRGVAVVGDHVFVANYQNGMQVFDRTGAPDLTLLGAYDDQGLAWDIDAHQTHAYLADGSMGLQMLDVSDPVHPVPVGTYRQVDPVESATSLAARGPRIAVTMTIGGLRILVDELLTVEAPADLAVPALVLTPAWPNPFNPQTVLAFTMPVAGHVRATVLDLRGREVAVLVDGERPAGRHEVRWDGRDRRGRALPSGTYLVDVRGCGEAASRKVSLVR